LLRLLRRGSRDDADTAHHRIEHFETHPDAPIITSRPGLGALTDAGVLAEIGEGCPRA